MNEYKYDVALSFANEQRDYAEQVANQLSVMGIECFYDNYYKAKLWGKNLLSFLEEVYGKKSRYCVMFISEAYWTKKWTHFECEVILERLYFQNSIDDPQQYLLPVRFDDTIITGIRDSWGFISAQETTPKELAHMIYDKIYGDERTAQMDLSRPNLDEIYNNLKRQLPREFVRKCIWKSTSFQNTDAILFFMDTDDAENDFTHCSGKIFLDDENKLQMLNLGFFDNSPILSEITQKHLLNQLLSKTNNLSWAKGIT